MPAKAGNIPQFKFINGHPPEREQINRIFALRRLTQPLDEHRTCIAAVHGDIGVAALIPINQEISTLSTAESPAIHLCIAISGLAERTMVLI